MPKPIRKNYSGNSLVFIKYIRILIDKFIPRAPIKGLSFRATSTGLDGNTGASVVFSAVHTSSCWQYFTHSFPTGFFCRGCDSIFAVSCPLFRFHLVGVVPNAVGSPPSRLSEWLAGPKCGAPSAVPSNTGDFCYVCATFSQVV